MTATPEVANTIFGDNTAAAAEFGRLLATAGIDRGVIGPHEGPRIWERHILNCAVIGRGNVIAEASRVADLGSGAGLPGIPLALARPDLSLLLVEPLMRRVAWLNDVIGELDLADRVRVVASRAEDAPGAPCDVVVSRAVAPLVRLLPWSAGLVGVGGTIVAIKGEQALEELAGVMPSLPQWRLGDARVARFGVGLLSQPTVAVVAHRRADSGVTMARHAKATKRSTS